MKYNKRKAVSQSFVNCGYAWDIMLKNGELRVIYNDENFRNQGAIIEMCVPSIDRSVTRIAVSAKWLDHHGESFCYGQIALRPFYNEPFRNIGKDNFVDANGNLEVIVTIHAKEDIAQKATNTKG